MTRERDPLDRVLASIRDAQPPPDLGHRIKTEVGYRPDGDLGWIPASILERSVEILRTTCPTEIDLASVSSLQPFERMICFGGRDLTFRTVTGSELAVGVKTSRRWISSDGHPD